MSTNDLMSYVFSQNLLENRELKDFTEAFSIGDMFTPGLDSFSALVLDDLYKQALVSAYSELRGVTIDDATYLAVYGKNLELYPLFLRGVWDHLSAYVTVSGSQVIVSSNYKDWVKSEILGDTTLDDVTAVKIYAVFLRNIQNEYNVLLAEYNKTTGSAVPYLEIHVCYADGSVFRSGETFDVIWSTNGFILDYDKVHDYNRIVDVFDESIDLYKAFIL